MAAHGHKQISSFIMCSQKRDPLSLQPIKVMYENVSYTFRQPLEAEKKSQYIKITVVENVNHRI